jgi:hypothetical protein
MIFSGVLIVLIPTACAAAYALHLGIQLHIRLGAMEKSTHNIQFVPAEDAVPDEAINRAIGRQEHDDWDGIDDIHQKSEPLM